MLNDSLVFWEVEFLTISQFFWYRMNKLLTMIKKDNCTKLLITHTIKTLIEYFKEILEEINWEQVACYPIQIRHMSFSWVRFRQFIITLFHLTVKAKAFQNTGWKRSSKILKRIKIFLIKFWKRKLLQTKKNTRNTNHYLKSWEKSLKSSIMENI